MSLSTLKPPKYPEYSDYSARLGSFKDWPIKYVPQKPEKLAESGLFYIGSADRTRCFQCGLTLRDWEEEHEPAVEHLNHSPTCTFINSPNLDNLGVVARTRETGLTISPSRCPPVSSDPSPFTSDDDLDVDSVDVEDVSQVDFNVSSRKENLISTRTIPEDHNTICSVSDLDLEADSVGVVGGAKADEPSDDVIFRHVLDLGFSKEKIDKARQTIRQRSNRDASDLDEIVNVILDAGNHSLTSPASLHKQNPDLNTIKPSEEVLNKDQPSFGIDKEHRQIRSLRNENRRLKERKTCKVCKKQDVSVLYLPCGHLITCGACADMLDECVICHKRVLGSVKTYLV